MSVTEDTRKIFQDFVALELRRLSGQMAGLEKTVDAKLQLRDGKVA